MPRLNGLIVTCEHGGNRVPPAYQELFAGHEALLESHRGWDRGALRLARALARRFDAPLVAAQTTRLLVDLNRSIGHPQLFSEVTRTLPPGTRGALLDRHYYPYRRAVESAIAHTSARRGMVVHLSAHSFTPELDGVARNADAALLYDPTRSGEKTLCSQWLRDAAIVGPDLRLRRNYPYSGRADGLTTAMRRRYPSDLYVGIEVEVNAACFDDPTKARQTITAMVEGLAAALRRPA